ncbi:MAG: 2-oxoglutarate dehydrogenase complex dihydrolipoyllysine-residue succinyltransferase [Planctomycetota bacterium]
MAVELKVPTVGESITEVQIGDWLVPEGQSANKEDALVVIETDKVTVELPAPVDGTVTRVLKKKGDTAAVGEVIGYIEEGAVNAAPKSKPAAKSESASSATATKAPPASRSSKTATSSEARVMTADTRVMPAAARALHTSGIAAEDVEPTGPGGRMLKGDVQRAAEGKPAAKARTGVPSGGMREEELVPMTPLRKRIAQRLVEAKNTAALLTTFNEIDMSAAVALRNQHKDAFLQKHGVKLGFMSFFVKASIDALKLVPQMNAEIRGDSIAYHNYCDIGVAVGGGKGLVVPVLRNAERMSFAEVELAIGELAARAQANKLTLDELTGGTFTISNGGVYGSLLSTPIVNPPQSGILGLHAIQDRPVALNGQVVIRPMMYVAVTYDHRLVDGREAVTFLKRIKDCVENPARMLLEV